MFLRRFIQKESREFLELSRKWHFVPLTAIVGPIVLFLSFLLFPLLEKHNLGYPVFHLACLFCFLLAGVGIVGWIAEAIIQRRWRAWLLPLVLVVIGFAYSDRRVFILIGIIDDTFAAILQSEQMIDTVHKIAVSWIEANVVNDPVHLYLIDHGSVNLEPLVFNNLTAVHRYLRTFEPKTKT